MQPKTAYIIITPSSHTTLKRHVKGCFRPIQAKRFLKNKIFLIACIVQADLKLNQKRQIFLDGFYFLALNMKQKLDEGEKRFY